MDLLKLAALDEEDLSVISAHVQDAVAKVGEMTFSKREKRFAMVMRRFAWEKEKGGLFRRTSHERRLAALNFDRVLAVRSTSIDKNRPETVLALLAVRFMPSDAPSGTIELAFSGGATIHLDVECIETRLSDLGAAWETPVKPRHSA
ncbi:DUF2948 family protein [Chelativorans sp. SCAU2101]|jgi:Protein of unknown function (DUF2948).|uniref:DUF2948 family protein n=1 Tax=Chelativorans petroleitrophicus TaxID=2975484 RepID=A0A9X2XA91_9HYPH|nr:DUF2948 family protein [Chelativorans petroleitrophicus]MCT8990332.1 DUF2948 family protein [Chelativorans petroleitrophicus]